jgi:hypothetical protein
MGIETKTLGILIDELITTNLKCYMQQELLMDTSLSDEERLQAAIKTQELNNRRNQLIRAIDAKFGEMGTSYSDKSYANRFGK